jgi:hypothetical protein
MNRLVRTELNEIIQTDETLLHPQKRELSNSQPY